MTTYNLPTGPATSWNFRVHQNALVRPLSRADLAPLQGAVRCLSRGIFGANCFELDTSKGVLRAEQVAPECGPTSGWGRWPGADHWHVSRDGRTLFRSQSYTFVLRYFTHALTK